MSKDGGLQQDSGEEIAEDGKYSALFHETKQWGAYSFNLKVVAEDVKPVEFKKPGVAYVEPEPVNFERYIEVSGTVDDRELDHLKCYTARKPQGGIVIRPRTVTLRDQFTKSVAKVYQPTVRNREKSRLDLEHFKCYEAKRVKEKRSVEVTLKDQFGRSLGVAEDVVSMCTPTQKNEEYVEDKKTHLTCYRLKERVLGGNYRGKRLRLRINLAEKNYYSIMQTPCVCHQLKKL